MTSNTKALFPPFVSQNLQSSQMTEFANNIQFGQTTDDIIQDLRLACNFLKLIFNLNIAFIFSPLNV